MAAHTDEKSESCDVHDFRANFGECAAKILVQQNFMNSVVWHKFLWGMLCQTQTISLLNLSVLHR